MHIPASCFPLGRLLCLVLRISLSFVLFTSVLYSQSSKSPLPIGELKRLQRMRPAPPYDMDGGYSLLDLWATLALTDTLPPKPSMLAGLVFGKIIPISPKWEMLTDGLVGLYGGSNSIDGSLWSYELVARYRPKLGYRWVIRSAHTWATKRQRYLSDNHLLYFYAPKRGGVALVSVGRTTYSPSHEINEEAFAETYLTPLGGTNSLHYIERDYLTLRNALYLSSALRSSLEMRYEGRRDLSLPTSRTYRSLHAELRLSYDFSPYGATSEIFPSPHRLPRGFFVPEVGMTYRWHHYLSSALSVQTAHQLELNLRMSYAFSAKQRLDWAVVGETILSGANTLEPSDYRYLSVEPIGRRPFSSAWATGRSLALSEGSWLWGQINYGGGRMALAYLPPARRLGLDERLHLKALIATDATRWAELGYTIGLGSMLRVGLFYGTDFGKKNEWAFRLSFPMLYLISRTSSRY